MWKAVNIHLSCAQPRPRYASFFSRFSASSQLTKPAWSAGRKAAQVTRKMRGARTQRNGCRNSARGVSARHEAEKRSTSRRSRLVGRPAPRGRYTGGGIRSSFGGGGGGRA